MQRAVLLAESHRVYRLGLQAELVCQRSTVRPTPVQYTGHTDSNHTSSFTVMRLPTDNLPAVHQLCTGYTSIAQVYRPINPPTDCSFRPTPYSRSTGRQVYRPSKSLGVNRSSPCGLCLEVADQTCLLPPPTSHLKHDTDGRASYRNKSRPRSGLTLSSS